MINDLVGGTSGEESSDVIKQSENNTTNNSTGDSQNSSSAEKLNLNKAENCEEDSSSNQSSEHPCVPNESMRSFITDSPFSFRNPIFFSVPRDQSSYTKQVVPVSSKRQLFFESKLEETAPKIELRDRMLPPRPVARVINTTGKHERLLQFDAV